MKYHVHTRKGELFIFSTGDINSYIDPKEGLVGRRFLSCSTPLGRQALVHIDSVEYITPAELPDTPKQQESPF